jgi:uncharacterized protein (TIGR02186 family)
MILSVPLVYAPMASAAPNSQIIIDMANESVDVTTGFSGSHIVVFGSIDSKSQETPASTGVAILLKGPDSSVIVRKKDQIAGMWLNSDSIEFKNIPHFYDYAISMPEKDMASQQTLTENEIGLNTLMFDTEDLDDRDDIQRYRLFQEALIRIWQQEGNLPLAGKQIKFIGNNLFRADFSLPANIPTGLYQVEAFLFEKGKLIDKRERVLEVRQAGVSALINHYAHSYSLLYALIGYAMAIGIGMLSAHLARKGR